MLKERQSKKKRLEEEKKRNSEERERKNKEKEKLRQINKGRGKSRGVGLQRRRGKGRGDKGKSKLVDKDPSNTDLSSDESVCMDISVPSTLRTMSSTGESSSSAPRVDSASSNRPSRQRQIPSRFRDRSDDSDENDGTLCALCNLNEPNSLATSTVFWVDCKTVVVGCITCAPLETIPSPGSTVATPVQRNNLFSFSHLFSHIKSPLFVCIFTIYSSLWTLPKIFFIFLL